MWHTLIISEFWTVGLTNIDIYKLPLTFQGNLNGIFFAGHLVDQASYLLIKAVIVWWINNENDHVLHVYRHCSTRASASLIPSGSFKVIIFHCWDYRLTLHQNIHLCKSCSCRLYSSCKRDNFAPQCEVRLMLLLSVILSSLALKNRWTTQRSCSSKNR